MNKKGFSLIELLVVVSIVGILAAVGIVAYIGYVAAAHRTDAKNINFMKDSILLKKDCL